MKTPTLVRWRGGFLMCYPDGMRAAKVDANQAEIVHALRCIGCSVQVLSTVGSGVPDLLVGFNGLNILMEVKDGKKPPSARKLTADQVIWHGDWRGQVNVVESVEKAMAVVAWYRKHLAPILVQERSQSSSDDGHIRPESSVFHSAPRTWKP